MCVCVCEIEGLSLFVHRMLVTEAERREVLSLVSEDPQPV